MFDKYLCKHIQRKTIRIGDIALAALNLCACGILLLLCAISLFVICSFVGAMCYNVVGCYVVPQTINDLLKYAPAGAAFTVVGCTMAYIVIKILGIEVAHCPNNEEEKLKL